MKEVPSYTSNASYAIESLAKNPKLFIPDLFASIASFIFLFLFFHINDLLKLAYLNPEALNDTLRSLITNTPSLIKLIVSFIIVLILTFGVHLGAICTRYVMIKKILDNKKIKVFESRRESRSYLLSVFLIKILLALIYTIPLSILGFLAFKFEFLIISISLLSALYLLFLSITFLFIYPTLILRTKKSAVKAIKSAFGYFKNNVKKSIIVFIIVTVISFIMNYIVYKFVFSFLNSILNFKTSIIIPFALLIWLIRTIFNMTVELWSELFIFKNY